MLLPQPHRFGRVFALDPVTPLGMAFNAEQIGLFRAMMPSRTVTRAVMATAAASLFVPESLAPNMIPQFRDGAADIQALFERIIEQTFGVSEGIWIGTPVNLTLERESRELGRGCRRSGIEHLVLWGEQDGWISPADLKAWRRRCRTAGLSRARDRPFDESRSPALYAGYFGAWFGGLAA